MLQPISLAPALWAPPAAWGKQVFVAASRDIRRLGSGNVAAFEFLVHRRAVDAENRGRRFDVAARVLQGRGNEQSFKLLECRADRSAPSQTRLRWSGIDAGLPAILDMEERFARGIAAAEQI
jgi:hypothetical protein